MTDPPSVVERLDMNTDKPTLTKSLQQLGREQQSQRLGLGDSLTMLGAYFLVSVSSSHSLLMGYYSLKNYYTLREWGPLSSWL